MSQDASSLVTEARTLFEAASREWVRARTSPNSRALLELQQELQAEHERLNRRVLALFRRKKGNPQRSDRLRRLQAKRADVLQELAAISGVLEMEHTQHRTRYYRARHLYLRAISQEAEWSLEAMHQKRKLMDTAGLSHLEPTEVWYHPDLRNPAEVHLFYGGGQSPFGEDTSPDGAGHGHVIVRRSTSGHGVDYMREPAAVAWA